MGNHLLDWFAKWRRLFKAIEPQSHGFRPNRHEDQEKEVRIMNLTTQNKMKFDTRLQGRRGWVDPKELEAAIESLEDSAGNLAEDEADSVEAAPEAGQEPS